MNNSPGFFFFIVIIVVIIAGAVGAFFLLRKLLRHKSCSTIFFGILLIMGGGVFLYPGIEMMKAFAETEKKTGAQVVFVDAPIFLGSPEAWIFIGAVMIIAGIYFLYRSFKPSTE